jgi:UDP-glucose 4-epimerase
VRALMAAMDNCSLTGTILNVCTGTATTIRELAKILGAILQREPEMSFAPPRQGEIRHSLGDPAKAQRILGFAASTYLSSGLIRSLADSELALSRPAVPNSRRETFPTSAIP